jgi:DNA-binding Xre family transcriptional regulator
MVNLRVQELARERGITTITELAEKANLAYDTARDLWHGRMQRIDRDVLGRVCLALGVKPGDILTMDEPPANKRMPALVAA